MFTKKDRPLDRVSYPFGIRTTRPLQLTVAVIVMCAIITGIVVDLVSPTPGLGVIPPLLAAVGLAIGWRVPYLGFALLACAPLVAAWTGEGTIVTWSILAMGSFLLTLRGSHSRIVAPVAALSAYVSEALVDADGFMSAGAFAALAVTFAAAATGSTLREHFRFLHSLEDRAVEAIQTRAAEQERAVTEQRLSIARDLHDVVGHQVAVVNMQIGMAEVALPEGAETSRTALHTARAGVKQILQESQRILTVLRSASEGDDLLQPAPTLSQLGELIASYRAIGLDVESDLGDAPRGIDEGVQTTAYRVAQEALTNARRHGDGTTRVKLRTTGTSLVLTIDNPVGNTGPSEGSGYGLLGIRERVQSVKGDLEVRALPRRFTLIASFPLHVKETA